MSAANPVYRPDVDGLRAVAILSVIVFHADERLLTGGFTGVDVFFVISGFLISSIILKAIDEGVFSFFEFYLRRVKRIFPALILVLAACYAFGWIVLLPSEFRQLGKHIGSAAIFISNLVLNSETGYFDVDGHCKPLLHLWSLGIEEQFYLACPLFLYVAMRRGWNVLAVMAGAALVSFSLNIFTMPSSPSAAFFLPGSRVWELLIGCMLAFVEMRHKAAFDARLASLLPVGVPLDSAKSWLGAALICLSFVAVSREEAFPGWWALLPTLGAFLLISAGPQAWVNSRILASRAFVWLGLISYPLYLWHYPILSYLRIIDYGTTPQWQLNVAMAVAVLLAWATYRLVERPIRFDSGRPAFFSLLIVMMLVGSVGLYTKNKNGIAERFKGVDAAVIAADQAPESLGGPIAAECQKITGVGTEGCKLTRADVPPSVALLGDSHAGHFYAGLAEYYGKKGGNLVNFWQGTCPPVSNVEVEGKRECVDKMASALDYVRSSSTIGTVILAFQGRQYTSSEDKVKVVALGDPTEKDKARAIETALDATLARLLGAGKKVVVMLDNPIMDFDPRVCSYVRPFSGRVALDPCAIKRTLAEQRNHESRQLLRELAEKYPSITVFDAFGPLCDEIYCYAKIGGTLLYTDDNHLNAYGSRLVSRYYAF